MSNSLLSGPSRPSSRSARIRWPVDEIGRNSVNPSMMPRRMAEAKRAGSMASSGLPGIGSACRSGRRGSRPASRRQGDNRSLRRALFVLQPPRCRGGAMSTNHPGNIDIAAALGEAQELYRARNPKSLAQYQEACAAMPGGNTRHSIYIDPFPLTMAKGEGSHLWDIDGHEYVDFLSEFTAGVFGH